jgi:hypothetical protein
MKGIIDSCKLKKQDRKYNVKKKKRQKDKQ